MNSKTDHARPSLRSRPFAMSATSSTSEHDGKDVDNLNSTKCKELEHTVNVKRAKPSGIPVDPRETRSERKIGSNANYNDSPTFCTWRFVTQEDVTYLKMHQRNKNVILSFLGSKVSSCGSERGDDIFLKIMWEFFKFARDHSFDEKGVSSTLGLVYLTHLFFLSHPWRTANEIHEFFREIIFLHAVMNPPKSSEIFTVSECKLLFDFFHKTYMENLVLLRIVCHPNYRSTTTLCTPNSKQGD